jgi:hypothetical protein
MRYWAAQLSVRDFDRPVHAHVTEAVVVVAPPAGSVARSETVVEPDVL